MKRVAITGISGYLGTLFLRRLEREDEVESIIGIDIMAPRIDSPKLRFYARDVRSSFTDLFAEHQVDTALHLAFQVTPIHDDSGSHRINLEGSQNFLKACEQVGVKQLFYMSSYTAYGAHADNPELLAEDAPLRPNPSMVYPVDKAKVDNMFQEYMKDHPDSSVVIVRTAAVVGPNIVAGGLTTLFTPVMMRASGHDPLWQFIHEDDLVEMVITLLKKNERGIFNAAADDGMRYSEIIKAMGKPSIALPEGLMSWATRLSWQLHLQSRSSGGVEILAYDAAMDTDKVKKATGHSFKYSGREAFMSFLDHLKEVS